MTQVDLSKEALDALVARMRDGCNLQQRDGERAADAIVVLRTEVEVLTEVLRQYKSDLCEGFCGEDGWHDAGHSHPDIQRDCGGCRAAAAILKIAKKEAL